MAEKWHTKYRPLRFTEVLGQEGHVKVLKTRIRNGSGLATSYLFSGGHGQGKTTLARVLARALLCQQLTPENEPCNECDNCRGILNGTSEAFVEQDAASRGTVEHMRAIVDDLPFAVQNAPKRIYLFDEAHRMSKDAQDVLLKPLEDQKLVGMFCTTEPEKIRGAIKSRCEDYAIRRVTREEIAGRMQWVLEQEKIEYEPDAVLTVVDFSAGHVRDILSRLEMIAQMGSVTVQAVRAYLDLGVITVYNQILLALGDPKMAVPLVEDACDRVGADEVATGLAEAAMNAFRLAHGMHTDYALSDRQLGERVHKMYGDSIIQLADFFLQSYKPSRVGLVCDVIRCAKGVPAPTTAIAAPPVVVAAPLVSTPAPAAPAPATPAASAAEAPAPAAAPAPAPAVQPEAPKPQPAAPVVNGNGIKPPTTEKLRSDGIGSLGTSDRLALTELDHKVVKDQHPRGAQRATEEKKVKTIEGGARDEILPHTQWRHEFEEAWRGAHEKTGSGSNGG